MFLILKRCMRVFLVMHNIWVYRESWIGALQWAQGMLQSQDFIFSVLSGQVVWSRCLTSKWQVNKEMEIIGEVGGRGRKNRKGRITAWRSSGVPRGVLSGKSASLKVACKCCYLRGMFLHLCQPWVGRDTLEQGFQWLAGQYNKFEWKLEKTYKRWLGNPVWFVLYFIY